MEKIFLRFDEVDSVIVGAAAQIYSAHIASSKPETHTKEQLIQESVEIAIRIAQLAEERVVGFKEKDAYKIS